VRVLHALIDQNDEVDILRGLPEGSQLSPTLFGICVAELILELRAKFPLLQFPQITSIDTSIGLEPSFMSMTWFSEPVPLLNFNQ